MAAASMSSLSCESRSTPQPVRTLGKNSCTGALKGSSGNAGEPVTFQRCTVSPGPRSIVGAGTVPVVSTTSVRFAGTTTTNSLRW